jgi:hypothetical protein
MRKGTSVIADLAFFHHFVIAVYLRWPLEKK